MERRLIDEVKSDMSNPRNVIDRRRKRLNDDDDEGMPKYASFIKNIDAKNFKLSVENYNELNFFEQKS